MSTVLYQHGLGQRLIAARRAVDEQRGQLHFLTTTRDRLTGEINDLTTLVDTYTRAAAVLTSMGEQRQADTQTKIEELVTQGLKTIFAEDLSFHLVAGVRAKAPVVDFLVRTHLPDGTTVDTDVMDARGGGLAAIVGFLLRLIRLLLSAQGRDTVIMLDETFAHVSAEYEPRLAEFIRDLADRTGVQIIMVTHSDAYLDAADVRYRFEVSHGQTKAKPL